MRPDALRRPAKAVAAVGLGVALMVAMSRPTYAGDGAIAAEIVGGAALGALAFGAAAGAYWPPPPPPYVIEPVEVGPMDIGPAEAGPPPCHEIIVESFDPYAGGYVETARRVCDGY